MKIVRTMQTAATTTAGYVRRALAWAFPHPLPGGNTSDRVSERPTSATDVYLLAVPLAVAIVNPGTGFLSGFYAAILVGLYLALKYWWRTRFATVDWVAGVAFLYVVMSPLWSYNPSYTVPASRGDAVSLAYFLVVRRVVVERRSFILYARAIAVLTMVYAVYFLLAASAYDLATSRVAVEFANANYTGAVLAFGGSLAIWLAMRTDIASRGLRIAWVGAYAVHVIAIVASGSRASLTGTLGALVVVFLLRWWRATWTTTGVLLVMGFVIGFFPQANGVFRWAASVLGGFGPFRRSEAAAADLSGRAEIWESTRHVIAQAPLFGSGSEGYRTRGEVMVHAHSWGLEYVASVGIVGAAILVAVLYMSFSGWRVGRAFAMMPRAAIWNSATAISLLPSLVLSAHQWTLWAWVGFALWSRSYVLDEFSRVDTRVPRHAHAPGTGDVPATEANPHGASADAGALSSTPTEGTEGS